MPNQKQIDRMQIEICYTDREWKIISDKLKNRKFTEYFIAQVNTHFKESALHEGEEKQVTRFFKVLDKDLQRAIKQRAFQLKMRPAKLISKLIFDPILYRPEK